MSTLDNNRLSSGPYMKQFETKFAHMHECKFGVMLNSGTSALHVSLAVLKEFGRWNDNDEVLVPASTFIATSNVVIHNNLTPVFVDIDVNTYNIDTKQIEKHITNKTRAIIPVHMYGHPSDMDQIMDISKHRKLNVIEDSCECMFAHLNNKSVGSFGDMGCFSTYVAHILTTGVGGLITTNNEEFATACRVVLAHGRDSDYLNIDDNAFEDDLEKLQNIVKKRFSFVRLGHSFRSTELEAALGLGQLEIADSIVSTRRKNAEILTMKLNTFSEYIQLPQIAPNREHSFMMYPTVCKKHIVRDNLVVYLEKLGIETRPMMPLLSQPIYTKIFGPNKQDDFPNAKSITQNGFYLPCHHGLSEEDINFMVENIGIFIKDSI